MSRLFSTVQAKPSPLALPSLCPTYLLTHSAPSPGLPLTAALASCSPSAAHTQSQCASSLPRHPHPGTQPASATRVPGGSYVIHTIAAHIYPSQRQRHPSTALSIPVHTSTFLSLPPLTTLSSATTRALHFSPGTSRSRLRLATTFSASPYQRGAGLGFCLATPAFLASPVPSPALVSASHLHLLSLPFPTRCRALVSAQLPPPSQPPLPNARPWFLPSHPSLLSLSHAQPRSRLSLAASTFSASPCQRGAGLGFCLATPAFPPSQPRHDPHPSFQFRYVPLLSQPPLTNAAPALVSA